MATAKLKLQAHGQRVYKVNMINYSMISPGMKPRKKRRELGSPQDYLQFDEPLGAPRKFSKAKKNSDIIPTPMFSNDSRPIKRPVRSNNGAETWSQVGVAWSALSLVALLFMMGDYLTLIFGAVLGVIGVAFSWKGLSLKPVPKWALAAASLGILVIVEGIILTLIK